MGRNTPILQEITDVLFADLDEQATALHRLETHFHHRLLVRCWQTSPRLVTYAEQLRLQDHGG